MSPRLGFGPKLPLRTYPAPKIAMDSAIGSSKPAKRIAQDHPLLALLGGAGALGGAVESITGKNGYLSADSDGYDQEEAVEQLAAWIRENVDSEAIVKLIAALQKNANEPAMDSRLKSGFDERWAGASRIDVRD